MLVKITAKRQVTLPAHVLDSMGVDPSEHAATHTSPRGIPSPAQAHRLLAAGNSTG